ncbi:MAG: hypothetical protein K2Q26_00545 [Bdellovibrionales bacterium]|nr:hypothetical protein [Bdellovibrionales bacterium]
MFEISKESLRKDINFLKDYLPKYFSHPIQEIKTAPQIDIEIMVITLFALNLIVGILRSFYSLSWLGFLANVIITPIFGCVMLLLVSLFTYYVLQFWLQKVFPFLHIVSIFFFAYLPGSLFFIASIYYPPLFIFGLILSCVLLTIGLTENLKIEKKMVLTAVSVSFFLCFLFWIYNFIFLQSGELRPKSLDELESEIQESLND